MKIAIIVGTRPEIIKMAPIVRLCELKKYNYFILHSGQHYSYNMDRIFFEDLELPLPSFNLNVGSGRHGEETGKMLIGIEDILLRESPDVVLVQGDTNTVLAGALAACKLHIKVGHIEAGLRSYDMGMPEEINRILTDHVSDYLFAPTLAAESNLRKEGFLGPISIVGNTIVDSVNENLELSERKSNILENMNLTRRGYFLVTAHRQENVDIRQKLTGILEGLSLIRQKYGIPIIYPIHPRTRKRFELLGIDYPQDIDFIDPVGFLDFLQLEANARLILTDSGGIQEESCILNVPCVTLRENTERPETLEVGSNVLAGTDKDRILNSTDMMLKAKRDWVNPFGDGTAARRIMTVISNDLE